MAKTRSSIAFLKKTMEIIPLHFSNFLFIYHVTIISQLYFFNDVIYTIAFY
jgi:hypothetical protein